MKKNILLVGGGGHCKSVIDTLLEKNEYDRIGIIDKKDRIGKDVLGIKIIGCDEDLTRLFKEGFKYAHVSIAGFNSSKLRIKYFEMLSNIGFFMPNIIDSKSNVSYFCTLKDGIFIGKNAVINCNSIIERGVIINTGTIIEHDCNIKSFANIASGSVVGGGVSVGNNAYVGLNTTIKQEVHIGDNSIIESGSVILKDIEAKISIN